MFLLRFEWHIDPRNNKRAIMLRIAAECYEPETCRISFRTMITTIFEKKHCRRRCRRSSSFAVISSTCETTLDEYPHMKNYSLRYDKLCTPRGRAISRRKERGRIDGIDVIGRTIHEKKKTWPRNNRRDIVVVDLCTEGISDCAQSMSGHDTRRQRQRCCHKESQRYHIVDGINHFPSVRPFRPSFGTSTIRAEWYSRIAYRTDFMDCLRRRLIRVIHINHRTQRALRPNVVCVCVCEANETCTWDEANVVMSMCAQFMLYATMLYAFQCISSQ